MPTTATPAAGDGLPGPIEQALHEWIAAHTDWPSEDDDDVYFGGVVEPIQDRVAGMLAATNREMLAKALISGRGTEFPLSPDLVRQMADLFGVTDAMLSVNLITGGDA